jgi:hypothetical protein
MFFGWVRTFVACFLGKRNLEVFTARLVSGQLNHRPEIRVFSVSSQLYRVPTWEEIEKVIKDALGDTSETDTDKIIQILRDIATGKTTLAPGTRHCQGVNILRQIVENLGEPIVLRMHCEAVLAALLEVRRDGSTSTDSETKALVELSEVLYFVPECEISH